MFFFENHKAFCLLLCFFVLSARFKSEKRQSELQSFSRKAEFSVMTLSPVARSPRIYLQRVALEKSLSHFQIFLVGKKVFFQAQKIERLCLKIDFQAQKIDFQPLAFC